MNLYIFKKSDGSKKTAEEMTALYLDLAKRFPEDTPVQFEYLPTLRALFARHNKTPADAIERLQSAIFKKSKTHDACRRKCDECWLLVVAPSFESSGTIHPDEKSLSHIYTSPFSRMYFLDFGLGCVHRLNMSMSRARAD